MHGLKFDKKSRLPIESNKNSKIAIFHTFWPKLICVIREPLFNNA